MRRLPALLFAFLVVSAGCADYLPWLEQSPEPETTSQPTPNPPPGANTEWIFDSERLLSAHESILAEMNYRKEVRIRPNHSASPLEWSNSTLVAHVGDGRIRATQRGHIGRVGSYEGYTTNNTTIWYVPPEKDGRYHSAYDYMDEIREKVENETRIKRILSSSDFTWNGTTVRNGTRLYRYRASTHTDLSGVKSLSATLFVDERGFIHELSGVLQTTGSRSVTVDFSHRFFETAFPPMKPDWANNAPQITVHFESGVIAIEHEGGAVVPAGTNVTYTLANDSDAAPGRIPLPKSLKSGDVAYISVQRVGEANGRLTADGSITVNQPPLDGSSISNSDWSVIVSMKAEEWRFIGFARSKTTDDENQASLS
ncbi:hypothetical protein [Haladaptatus sp. NG-SE-30]